MKLAVSLSLLLLYFSRITVVYSCGGFFCRPLQPVVQSAETIAFGVQQKGASVAVTMKVQIQYDGPSESFSWILPLPSLPEVSVGTDVLFARLMERTNPSFQVEFATATTPSSCEDTILCRAPPVAAFGGAFGPELEDSSAAVVLDSGSVGPFDFVIIEAAENDNDSAYRWLNENGYDQPEGSGELLNYYAAMDMKFLALKLSKNNDAGDIQPIVLDYEITNGSVLNDALACVPIKLTAVAAASALPVQVFLMGPFRGVPVNYLEAEMDLEMADWLGCMGSPNCYLNDHRARANAMFRQLKGKAFTTEYSGDSSTFAEGIQLDIDVEGYKGIETAEEYLRALQRDNVPYTNQVHGIVSEYIEAVTRPEPGSFCSFNSFTFPPASTRVCLDGPTLPESTTTTTFDAVGLTEKLDSEVFQPLAKDEEWVLSHAKVTRMYGNFGGPGDMTKDPFFAFNANLPDKSNVVRATATPECREKDGISLLNFNIAEQGQSFSFEARNECGQWRRSASGPLFNTTIPTAKQLIAQSYRAELTRTVVMDNGLLVVDDLNEIESVLDARVPNQTLPEWPVVLRQVDPNTGELSTAPVATSPMENTTVEVRTTVSPMASPRGSFSPTAEFTNTTSSCRFPSQFFPVLFFAASPWLLV